MFSNALLNAFWIMRAYLISEKVSEKSKHAIRREMQLTMSIQLRLEPKNIHESKNVEILQPVKRIISCVLQGKVFPRFLNLSIFLRSNHDV